MSIGGQLPGRLVKCNTCQQYHVVNPNLAPILFFTVVTGQHKLQPSERVVLLNRECSETQNRVKKQTGFLASVQTIDDKN